MELVQCIYCSASAKTEFSPVELKALLEECREKNARANITGMLLYHNRSFFQILEEDRSQLDALFKKISKDKRHDRITPIIVEPIEERSFAEWTMGYSKITPLEIASIPGLNDFFSRGSSFLDLSEGRAKALLGAFKEGQWRASLT